MSIWQYELIWICLKAVLPVFVGTSYLQAVRNYLKVVGPLGVELREEEVTSKDGLCGVPYRR